MNAGDSSRFLTELVEQRPRDRVPVPFGEGAVLRESDERLREPATAEVLVVALREREPVEDYAVGPVERVCVRDLDSRLRGMDAVAGADRRGSCVAEDCTGDLVDAPAPRLSLQLVDAMTAGD